MGKSFSFNVSSQVSVNGKKVFSSSVDENQKLTAQQEYWLNRFLRDYSGKIFFLALLFMILMFVIVILAYTSGQSSNAKTFEANYVLIK